jgi:hypothetical protein
MPTTTKIIDLREENPVAVDCMMQFFYGQNYSPYAFADASSDEPVAAPTTARPALHIHVLVHKLAEVYRLDLLKSLALTKFQHEVSQSLCVEDFVSAIQEAFEAMHPSLDGLRQAALKGFHQHRKQLLDNPAIQLLLCENGIIGCQFLIYLKRNSHMY